jgi:hypothetical protein
VPEFEFLSRSEGVPSVFDKSSNGTPMMTPINDFCANHAVAAFLTVVRSSDRAKLMPLVCRSFGQFSVNGGINEVTMNAKTSCRCTKASSAVATHDLGRRTAGDTDRISAIGWV